MRVGGFIAVYSRRGFDKKPLGLRRLWQRGWRERRERGQTWRSRGQRGEQRTWPRARRARYPGPRTASSWATTRILVLGSLMSGNHQFLAVPGARLIIAEARTEPGYELRDFGAFPGMVRGGAGAVIGEVYEVDESTLAALERLEGRPRFYTRTSIALEDGTIVEAYLLPAEQVSGRPVVLSGDWRARRRDRAEARDFDTEGEA